MNHFLVKLNNGEAVGFLETDRSYQEVEKIYLVLQNQENDILDILYIMQSEYGIHYYEFEDDCLYLD